MSRHDWEKVEYRSYEYKWVNKKTGEERISRPSFCDNCETEIEYCTCSGCSDLDANDFDESLPFQARMPKCT